MNISQIYYDLMLLDIDMGYLEDVLKGDEGDEITQIRIRYNEILQALKETPEFKESERRNKEFFDSAIKLFGNDKDQ